MTASKKARKRRQESEERGELFTEAEELGIGFILLAGGEPFLRLDVLEEAATHHKILFPIFTNGTIVRSRVLFRPIPTRM